MTRIQQLFLTSLLIVWISYAKSDVETEDESEFTYFGVMGPEHWSEHYNQCAGKHQSPINIREVDVEHRNYTDIKYEHFEEYAMKVTMLNNGHTVLVQMAYNGSVPTISEGPLEGKGKYKFQQLHFHWGEDNTVGSEDRINNVSYPMELHAVFFNDKYDSFEEAAHEDDGIAVMAAFYEVSVGHGNHDYERLTSHFQDIHEPHTNTTTKAGFSLYSLLAFNMNSYYTYIGSLTTPPCSEDVVWIDYVKPIKISPERIERFRDLKTDDGSSLTHNFRPVQPLNNRKVFKATEAPKTLVHKTGGSDIALVSAWDDMDSSASRSITSLSLIYLISCCFLTSFVIIKF